MKTLEKFCPAEYLIYKPSGGKQQRVAIARALVLNHNIIVKDFLKGDIQKD